MTIDNMPDWMIPALVLLIFWTMFWKFVALWNAARKKNKHWFFIIFFFNTIGILEIIYLFYFEKIKFDKLFK